MNHICLCHCKWCLLGQETPSQIEMSASQPWRWSRRQHYSKMRHQHRWLSMSTRALGHQLLGILECAVRCVLSVVNSCLWHHFQLQEQLDSPVNRVEQDGMNRHVRNGKKIQKITFLILRADDIPTAIWWTTPGNLPWALRFAQTASTVIVITYRLIAVWPFELISKLTAECLVHFITKKKYALGAIDIVISKIAKN